MRLKLLPLMFLLHLTASLRVNCRFEIADFEDFVGDVYSCNVGSIRVQSPNLIVERIDGAHMDGKSSDDVKAILLYTQDFDYMPQGLGSVFQNIEALHFEKTDLRVVNQEDLKQFPKLKSLWLNDGRLRTLESGVFQFNPKLKVIKFQFNQIHFIAADIFDPIEDLDQVDFSANACISNRAFNQDQLEELKEEILRTCQTMQALSEANSCQTVTALTMVAFTAFSLTSKRFVEIFS